jgi:hypothetical protein
LTIAAAMRESRAVQYRYTVTAMRPVQRDDGVADHRGTTAPDLITDEPVSVGYEWTGDDGIRYRATDVQLDEATRRGQITADFLG